MAGAITETVTSAVPVSLLKDMQRLATLQNKRLSEILRGLTEEFLKRHATRLAEFKELPAQEPKRTAMTVGLKKSDAENLKTVARLEGKSASQVLREEAEKYVEANRALLNNA